MLISNSDTMALGELIGEERGKITGQSFGCAGTQNGNLLYHGGKL
jgi:hypothetical protein